MYNFLKTYNRIKCTYFVLLLLVFSFNIKSQNNSLVDSLLLSIQSKAVDQNIAMKSLTIPYDKIVNNLDKCLFIYKNLHESNVFKNNDLKTAEIIDKLALVTYLKGNANESFILRKKSIELFDKVKDYRQKATEYQFSFHSKEDATNIQHSERLLAIGPEPAPSNPNCLPKTTILSKPKDCRL